MTTAATTIADLLAAPLGPDWTVDGLAERILSAITDQPPGSEREFVIAADDTTDRQVGRLIRPLLACLAAKSAGEAGTPVGLYGGHPAFERASPAGPVWVVGEFENRPGSARRAAAGALDVGACLAARSPSRTRRSPSAEVGSALTPPLEVGRAGEACRSAHRRSALSQFAESPHARYNSNTCRCPLCRSRPQPIPA